MKLKIAFVIGVTSLLLEAATQLLERAPLPAEAEPA